MAAPTLVINGVSAPDAAERCPRVTAQQSEGGAPAGERVAPDLFRNFEPNSAMSDRTTFSEWLRAEARHAEMAAAQVKDFLARHLKPQPMPTGDPVMGLQASQTSRHVMPTPAYDLAHSGSVWMRDLLGVSDDLEAASSA